MFKRDHISPSGKLSIASKRLREAMAMQEIEGNPLDAADIAMFEMFEREGWSHERRRAYIIARAKGQEPRPEAAE